MKEPQRQQPLQTDEEMTLVVSGEEATLVSPRFDDEETLVARPVVPLDAEAVEAAGAHGPAAAPHAAHLPQTYAGRPFAPRRSWALATVLVSVLVGGVLGGAGLYIYQRQSQDDRAVTTTQQPEAPAETQPEPAAEVSNAPPPEAPAPAVAVPAEPAPDGGETAESPAREPEVEPAAPRKRGKKGEHDAEVERRAPRPDAVRPVARAEDDGGARGVRRVDSIVYRPRRAPRRARRDAADTDRLRRIFEGTPE
ncbi:MAG: hypothetical protein LC795_09265 [Acidobacteria bacterium]|nr:hypothetical protein [Acidobacteriota bacterium]